MSPSKKGEGRTKNVNPRRRTIPAWLLFRPLAFGCSLSRLGSQTGEKSTEPADVVAMFGLPACGNRGIKTSLRMPPVGLHVRLMGRGMSTNDWRQKCQRQPCEREPVVAHAEPIPSNCLVVSSSPPCPPSPLYTTPWHGFTNAANHTRFHPGQFLLEFLAISPRPTVISTRTSQTCSVPYPIDATATEYKDQDFL